MTIPDKEKKMMSTYLLFAVLVASVSHMETSGVKMFLTKNGMQYGKEQAFTGFLQNYFYTCDGFSF